MAIKEVFKRMMDSRWMEELPSQANHAPTMQGIVLPPAARPGKRTIHSDPEEIPDSLTQRSVLGWSTLEGMSCRSLS